MDKKITKSEDLQRIENEILLFIKKICEENHISYFLAAGTVLGAVRHKGFIPWDDDVDLYMFREDYNRFREAMKGEADTPYKLLYIDTEPNYTLPLPKVIDTRTVLTQFRQREKMQLGVYVDVFILDNVPDEEKERERYLRKVLFLSKLWSAAQNKDNDVGVKGIKIFLKRIAKRLLWLVGPRYFAEKLDVLAQKYNNTQTKLCGNMTYSTNLMEAFVPKTMYGKGVMLEFEGAMYQGPEKTEEYLRHFYGDYMQLPPIEQRVSKHHFEAYYV